MRKYNVLIFPCGSENALEIYEAIRWHVDVWVLGGSSVRDHGEYAYENYEGTLPRIENAEFIEILNTVLRRYNINYIFPTHDTVLMYLCENASRICARIIGPEYRVARLCREKRKIYEILVGNDFLPILYDRNSIMKVRYPLFIKPNCGEGGKNTYVVSDSIELRYIINKVADPLICEFLPGRELTVDCFTDKNGILRFIGPRTRERIKMGISFHSETYPLSEEISKIARTINSIIKLRGLWFFQIKKSIDNKFKLMEVSARCAGTMGLYRQLGINFPLLSLLDAAGCDLELIRNDNEILLDRCLRTRYKQAITFKNVYIDLDDTIIVHNRVNMLAINFLYQCNKYEKHVVLISRHEKSIDETLNKYFIHAGLFDEKINLSLNEKKEDYVKLPESIYIDNSFSERKAVSSRCSIPVFDVDAISSLLIE